MARINLDVRTVLKPKELKGRLARAFGVESEKTLKSAGEELIDLFVKSRLSGNPIKQRSGKLADRKSFQLRVTPKGSATKTLNVAIQGPQVAMLEEKGVKTITPKNSTYLAIPTDEARDSDGVPLWRGPRSYPYADDDELIKTDNGYLVRGPNGRIYYVYVKSVEVRAELGFKDFIKSNKVKNLLRRHIRAFRKDFLREAGL